MKWFHNVLLISTLLSYCACDDTASGSPGKDTGADTDGTFKGCLSTDPGKVYSTLNLLVELQQLENSEEDKPVKINANKFYGSLRDRFYIRNEDGKHLTVQFREDLPKTIATIRGSEEDWESEYVLAKVDIYWSDKNEYGAQHAINKELYPFEIQIVHYQKDKESLDEAAASKHGILVLSILYEGTAQPNPSLDPIIAGSLICIFPTEKFHVAHGPIDIKGLFPYDLTNLQYTGAYVGHPCAKEAKFVVFVNPRQISFKQLDKIREIRTPEGEKSTGVFTGAMIDSKIETAIKNPKLNILKTAENNYAIKPKPRLESVGIILIVFHFVLKYFQ